MKYTLGNVVPAEPVPCVSKDDPQAKKWTGKSQEYQKTINGKECKNWTRKTVDGKGHNYCRNPTNGKTVWCYTTDPTGENAKILYKYTHISSYIS